MVSRWSRDGIKVLEMVKIWYQGSDSVEMVSRSEAQRWYKGRDGIKLYKGRDDRGLVVTLSKYDNNQLTGTG
jgi:hypothetical protein